MERKLIKQGRGGLTIYLPKKWLDRKKLKEGDSIKILEKETSLLISGELTEKKKIEINITKENKNDLKNVITHVYRKGFDTIKINDIDEGLFKEIKKILSEVILGFEIIEKTSKHCTIENISEPRGEKYNSLLKKIFFIIQETQKQLLEDAEKKEMNNFDEIKEMRFHQDKLILLCRRLLIKEKVEIDPLINWELLTFLMHIEHAYYYLYEYAHKNKIILSNETTNLIKNLGDYFDLYYNAFYEKDISYIHKLNKLKNEYQFKKCLQLIEKLNGKESVIASYLRELFRLIQIGTSPILSELIEKEIK